MRYQIVALRIALAEQLKRPLVWLMLAAILASAPAVRQLAAPEEKSAAACVGVVLPEEGAEEFWERLRSRGGQAVDFVLSDEETLRQNVAVSRWDCGLILPADFDERLDRGDLDEAVTLVTGPGSAVFPLVRETVAAVLAEQVAPVIAREYLLQRGLADESSLAAVDERLEDVLPAERRVDVVLETLDGETLDDVTLAEDGLLRAILGSLAILFLVWGLYTAIDLARWRVSPPARRMAAVRSVTALLLPRLIAPLIVMYAVGALGLTAAFGERGIPGALALAPYLAALGALALLLAKIRGIETILPAVIPAAAAACFVLCPVILDVSLLLPSLAEGTEWIMVTLYLRACEAESAATAKLLGMAAVLALAAAVWPCNRKHSA